MADISDFMTWLEKLTRFATVDRYMDIACTGDSEAPWRGDRRVKIYTAQQCYCLTALSGQTKTDDGYLGCVVSSRMPRAGEDWTRGNDLADGALTKKTFNRIMSDIVSYEMVQIMGKPAQASAVCEGPEATVSP